MEALNILIIEDNEDHLFFIKKNLSSSYYNLEVITNGKEAYNYLLNPKIKPDVVLLDSHLPGMGGLTILKKLKSKKIAYGIILTTVDTDTDIYVKAVKNGATDIFLKKPEYLYTLTQKIEKVYKFHQSELQKKETEANFNSIIESSLDDIWSIDTNYKLTAFNHSFKKTILRIVNYDVKIGDSILEIYSENNNDIWKPRYDKVLKGVKSTFEFSHPKDKLFRYYEVNLSPIIVESAIVGLSGIGRDITKRKLNEKALIESKARLQEAQDITHLGTFVFDDEIDLFETSVILDTILGIDANYKRDIQGWISLIHPEDFQEAQKLLDNNSIKTIFKEFRIIRPKDKKVIWVLCSVVKEFNNKGIRSKITGTIQDITVRKKIENEIKLSNQRFEKLFEQNPISLWEEDFSQVKQLLHNKKSDINNLKIYLDENPDFVLECLSKLKILNINKATVDLFGLKNKKDITQHLKDTFNETSFVAFKKELLNIASNKAEFKDYTEFVKTDGTIISAIVKVVTITNTDKVIVSIIDITERKQLENSLFEKNQFFKKTLNKTPLAFIYFDTDSIIKRWNPAAEIIFGYTAKETIGKNIMDLIVPKEILEDIKKVRDNIFDEVGGQINQNENITKSGKRIICNWYNTEIKDENNKVIGVSCLVENITERKKIEKELFEKEQQMSSIYNTVGDIIFYLTIEGEEHYRFTSVNSAFANAIGLPKESVIGKLVTEIIPEPSLSLVLEKYKEAITKKTIISWEETTQYPTGKKIGAVSISPIFDNDGVCTQLVGSVHDITERIESSKKINESNEFLTNTLESMTDAYISLDKNWIYTYVNKKAGEMFGRNPDELVGKHIWTEFPEGIDQPFYKNYHLAVENNISLIMEDYYAPWDKWFENRIVPSKKGLAIFFHDVTEKKKAIKKIEIQNKQLLDTQKIAQLGSYNVDLNTRNTECSFTFNIITGFETNEIINLNYWHDKMVHPDDVEDNKKMLNHCILTGEKFNREYRIYTNKNKKLKWLHGLGKIIYKNNKATNFVGTIQDITQRKRNDITKEIIYNITKKAGTSHNLTKLFNFIKIELSQLIDTNNFFIALYNETTNMISTPFMVDEQDSGNDFPKGKTLTGYVIDTKKTLLAKESDIKQLVKAKKIKRIGPNAACWLGVPLLINYKVIGAMVIQSYTDINAYSQEDVALVELIASNISQAIKQSQDLEQINLLNHALTQSPESVVVTNIKGDIEYVNPAFTLLSGYKAEEVLGKNPRFLKTGTKDKDFYKNLWKTILSGKIWSGEFVNKDKNGENYLVKANISSVKNKKGKITHFVGVEEDITKKRKLEHDFLHALIDAQEIEKQSFGEELHDGISQILSAQTMYVDVLKTLTKASKGKIPIYLDKVKELNSKAINETRSIAHGLMSKQLKDSGLIIAVKHICIDYSESRDINFLFSCKGLKENEIDFQIKSNTFRIIQEVATNTVRHSLAKNAKISLSKTNKNQLKIILEDNGVGVNFERIKENKKGAGIENIKRRVALLNGTVNIKTELNKGTQYTLLIPLNNIS